jgi:nucleoside-diphosphate-sugar epimerase
VATLITGGTGLIGTTLAEQLLAAGRRVVLLDAAHRRQTRAARQLDRRLRFG